MGSHNLANELSAVLPWDRFSSWIHCACVVNFDLELGQSLELVYPPHVKLTDKEKTNICYLSFPDSNSGCMGDTQFHFRIRQCGDVKRFISNDHIKYNKDCPVYNKIDNGYFFGYVYFRQVRDKTLRRGYFQKSLVLLTRLPFHSLFYYILELIAPEYFENEKPSLEAACHDIDQWLAPLPSITLHLPLLGNILQVRIPSCLDANSSTSALTPISLPASGDLTLQTSLPAPHILPSVCDLDLYKNLVPVLQHIQLLWELVLTNEPIAVMASSPTQCSNLVQNLISMIQPLRFCSDYRPFFTIHDTEFKEYTTKTQAPPQIILGVTNPYFAKTLQHWAHIVRVGDDVIPIQQPFSLNKSPNKLKKATNLKTLDSKPGLYTSYKSYLTKDKQVLKNLGKGLHINRPTEAQTAILRRYFLEITQSFIIPLERYVASLMPLKRDVSPFKGLPALKPFNMDNFLTSVEQSGPQLTSGLKGDWNGLYQRFVKSSNFTGWLRSRFKEMSDKLQIVQLQILAEEDIKAWSEKDKSEVEIVDMVLKIKEKALRSRQQQLPVDLYVYQSLDSHISTLISLLPEDLKQVLSTSNTITRTRLTSIN